ncbi:MAG: hypothetical protein GY940_31755, partial [bacterium]|nr:hypothetical protein [bacterium]
TPATSAADQDALMVRLIQSFCLATAPGGNEYIRIFEEEFHKTIREAE